VLWSGISRRMMLGLPAMLAVEAHERVHELKGVELICRSSSYTMGKRVMVAVLTLSSL
jgi:hypothetical protein